MKAISVVLIAALLLQIGYAPCAAQEGVAPTGDEIDRTGLTVGTFVEVVYRSEKGKRSASKGYVTRIPHFSNRVSVIH